MSGFWEGIINAAKALDAMSYYQVLGVDRHADGSAVRDAYYNLIKVAHPDRHALETDPERRDALVRLYTRIGEAYEVLSDPRWRREYDRVITQGVVRLSVEERAKADIPVRDPSSPKARDLYEAGTQLLERGDEKGARSRWELAIQYEPESVVIRQAIDALDGPAPAAPAPAAPAAATTANPRGRETRAHPRYPMTKSVKIRCKSWEHFKVFQTRDMSRGGMFVTTSTPLDVGSSLHIEVALPDGRVFDLDAKVAHVVSGEGMGIEFAGVDNGKRAEAEAIIASLDVS